MTHIQFKRDDLSTRELAQVIRIHLEQINQGFLSSLGEKALTLMFSVAGKSENVTLIAAIESKSGDVRGFLFGTLSTGSMYRSFLVNYSVKTFLVLLPKLFSFRRIWRMIEILLYPLRGYQHQYPEAELLDIAIDGPYQGQGIARLLFREFELFVKKHGYNAFKITTGEELHGAQRFYERLGAERAGVVEIHSGHKTVVYTYQIP